MDLLKQKLPWRMVALAEKLWIQIKQWIYYSKLQKGSWLESLHQLLLCK